MTRGVGGGGVMLWGQDPLVGSGPVARSPRATGPGIPLVSQLEIGGTLDAGLSCRIPNRSEPSNRGVGETLNGWPLTLSTSKMRTGRRLG